MHWGHPFFPPSTFCFPESVISYEPDPLNDCSSEQLHGRSSKAFVSLVQSPFKSPFETELELLKTYGSLPPTFFRSMARGPSHFFSSPVCAGLYHSNSFPHSFPAFPYTKSVLSYLERRFFLALSLKMCFFRVGLPLCTPPFWPPPPMHARFWGPHP